jgi:acyl-CoA thioester hydrolase
MEVRYGDLDPQGHVNNAKHLTYFEQARIAYMVELGLFTKDQSFMEIGVILADVHITYLAPIHFGEHIKVGVPCCETGDQIHDVGAEYCGRENRQRISQGRSDYGDI